MKLTRMLDFLYGSTPAEFESQFDLEESIRRLASATLRVSGSSFLTKQVAVGKVTERHVSLQRVIPMVGNSFKPFFRGSFQQVGNRVLLMGCFTLHPLAKVFGTIWFGFIVFTTVFATVLAIASAINGKPCYWWFPFFGVGMFALGRGLVAVGKWFARNDTRWLSDVIQNALCSPTSTPCAVAGDANNRARDCNA